MLQLNQIGNLEDEKEMPELYYWASLFKATTWEEIQMLAEKNESIKIAKIKVREKYPERTTANEDEKTYTF